MSTSLPFLNLALANWNLPAIIWCFASLDRLVILQQSAAGTSVRSEQDRRFRVSSRLSRLRFRGSTSVLSRATARRNARGAVSVGAVSSVARQRDDILDVALRGCVAAFFACLRADEAPADEENDAVQTHAAQE
jgi:predicted pyridoxine 5'-phosphate oxidase superfamily flavin-nucleotide-binding protein